MTAYKIVEKKATPNPPFIIHWLIINCSLALTQLVVLPAPSLSFLTDLASFGSLS